MKKTLKLICCSSILLFSASTASNVSAQLNEQTRITTAIDLIKVACATGEKLDIEVSGDAGISLIKRGGTGRFNFTKEEINGVIKGTNQGLAKEENEDIRKCMQQYVPAILDKLLESKAASASLGTVQKDSNYYLKEQRIPVDIPISILDGKPLLNITKIYEGARRKLVDISIEIPYRQPYRFRLMTLSTAKAMNAHESLYLSKFEYRDVIYRITVNHINLQEQFATITIMKYNDVNQR